MIWESTSSTEPREFGYIFSAAEKAAAKDPAPGPPNGFVDGIDYSNISDAIVSPGFDAVSYDTNCSNALSSNVDLTGQYSLPFASAKGGLDASFSTSSSYSVSIVAGRFESPVLNTLNNLGSTRGIDPAVRANLALLIWDWYLENPTRIGQNNYLLRYFDGLLTYEQGGEKRDVHFNANASASVGVAGIVNLSTTDGLSLSQSSIGTTQNFRLAIYMAAGAPLKDYDDLPNVPRLATIIQNTTQASIDSTLTPADRSIIADGATIPFFVNVRGIPRKDCSTSPGNNSTWSFADARVQITSVQPTDTTSALPTCQFSMLYTATSGDYSQGGVVKSNITSPAMPPPGNQTASIRVPPIAFTPTSNPQLQMQNGSAAFPFDPPATGALAPLLLVWHPSFRLVYDAVRPISDAGSVDVSGLYVDCGSESYYPLASAGSLTAGGQDGPNVRTFNFALTITYKDTAASLSPPAGLRNCVLKGPVVYNLPTGTIKRSLTGAPIVFPAKLPS